MRSIAKLTTVAAIAALAVAGCSSAKTDTAATPGSSGAAANKKIAFVQGVAGDEFYITMECGIKEKAAALGYTVETQGPQKFDPTLQLSLIHI